MALRLTMALLAGCVCGARAQTPAPAELIDRLVANAEQYRDSLPSLTADESIVSDNRYLIFKRHAEARGTFRAMRGAPGAPLEESRVITELNGKAVEPGKSVNLPATLFGGFGRFQEMFFTPQHRRCFSFTLLPDRGPGDTIQIAIEVPAETLSQAGCESGRDGLSGLARVDPATQQVVHLERTVPDELAARTNLALFASVDLAPTRVGEETFWLPTAVVGRVLNGKQRGEFVAHYTNYHRYAATIRVLPGAAEVDPAATPPASTPP